VKATASTGRRAVSRNGKAAKGRAAPAQSKKTQEEDVVIAGVKLSNPNKVLYPEQGLTKRDLAEYYEAIAGHMIPHVRNRPLMIVRCPQGRGQKCFYQKHMNDGVPEPWRGVRIKEQTETGVYVVLDDAEGLVALAQLGVLEIHTWGCRADKIEQPDQIIFDLDPSPEVGWIQVVEAARAVRDRLAEIGLVSFVKTTGGKGLHVVAPLVPRAEWPEVKAFTKSIADAMTADDPKRYIATMSKAKRTGKIFVDYLRNGRGATAVAAYSTRARLNAPVSMPIRWEDLSRLKGADVYRVPEAVAHMNKSGDPWDGFFKVKQSLTKRLLASAGVD
jgi:bifunctional non-homologous end joining protein LigD